MQELNGASHRPRINETTTMIKIAIASFAVLSIAAAPPAPKVVPAWYREEDEKAVQRLLDVCLQSDDVSVADYRTLRSVTVRSKMLASMKGFMDHLKESDPKRQYTAEEVIHIISTVERTSLAILVIEEERARKTQSESNSATPPALPENPATR